jgi:hypothetical protein
MLFNITVLLYYMLSAHLRILERLVESNGASASMLIYNREKVVDYLRRNGFIEEIRCWNKALSDRKSEKAGG